MKTVTLPLDEYNLLFEKVKVAKNNEVECRIYKPQFSSNELTYDEEIVFHTKEKVLQDVSKVNKDLVECINNLKRENHFLYLRNLSLEIEMELEFAKNKKSWIVKLFKK